MAFCWDISVNAACRDGKILVVSHTDNRKRDELGYRLVEKLLLIVDRFQLRGYKQL